MSYTGSGGSDRARLEVSVDTILSVSAARTISYDVVHLTHQVFDVRYDTLARLLESRPVVIIVDENVDSIYGVDMRRYVRRYLNCEAILTLNPSESNKSWEQVEQLSRELIKCGLRRDGIVVAIGGGVTLDVAGVAASLYRRGVRFVRIPTTLVGLVDAGVGIKHGINFAGKKSALGMFYPPFKVINDVAFLHTLARSQLACGIAEIIKIALVCDARLFESVEQNVTSLLNTGFQIPVREAQDIVLRAESAMIRELQPNLFEQDLRRLVDFGHTFSPLLEASSNYEIAHGEAVAIDMLISIAIGQQRGLCDSSLIDRVLRIYLQARLPLSHALCTPDLLSNALSEARIHRGGDLNLVVPTDVGAGTYIGDVSASEIDEALAILEHRARNAGTVLAKC